MSVSIIGFIALVIFGTIHAYLRINGESNSDILDAHSVTLILAECAIFFSGSWHGTTFSNRIVFAIVVALSCGVSVLTVEHLITGVVVGVLYLAVLVGLDLLAYAGSRPRENG